MYSWIDLLERLAATEKCDLDSKSQGSDDVCKRKRNRECISKSLNWVKIVTKDPCNQVIRSLMEVFSKWDCQIVSVPKCFHLDVSGLGPMTWSQGSLETLLTQLSDFEIYSRFLFRLHASLLFLLLESLSYLSKVPIFPSNLFNCTKIWTSPFLQCLSQFKMIKNSP